MKRGLKDITNKPSLNTIVNKLDEKRIERAVANFDNSGGGSWSSMKRGLKENGGDGKGRG